MFYLRDKDSKVSAVYLHYRKSKNGHFVSCKYPTRISVNPDEWNSRTHRLQERDGIDYVDTNKELTKIESVVKGILADYPFERLNDEMMKKEIDARLLGKKRNAKDFLAYCDNLYPLQKFRSRISMNDIDYSFFSSFVDYLEDQGKTKNYIASVIRKIKARYTDAIKEGLAIHSNYKEFSYSAERVTEVYLDEQELDKIFNLKLKSKRLDNTRDLFLTGCWTGMRCENYTSIDPDIHINREQNYIEMIINKGGPKVKIPIHRILAAILDKRGGLPPETIHHTNLNRNVKKICRLAGITQMVETAKTIGGVRVVKAYPKYSLISSHTARRSMATNLWIRQAPIRYIMGITGHRTESTCMRYILAGFNDVYDDIAKLDFWNDTKKAEGQSPQPV